jgi:hypothetical protein
MNLGGVKHTTIMACPRCERGIGIPAGMILRLPAKRGRNLCHEVVNPVNGEVVKRG